MKITKDNVRLLSTTLVAVVGLAIALPAQSMMVYRHIPTSIAAASLINSNALTNAEGSDQDVTAYDNFTLNKSAIITSVAWSGASSNKGLVGFTIKIYTSMDNPAAQPDTANPLAVIDITGNAGEKSVGNNLSDYHANFYEPLALKAGVQYWISIVSSRNDLSPWGWANGKGGDGKSIQSHAEFKVLPAPSDRAFSLNDGRAHGRKR